MTTDQYNQITEYGKSEYRDGVNECMDDIVEHGFWWANERCDRMYNNGYRCSIQYCSGYNNFLETYEDHCEIHNLPLGD